jgi:opacity protein-like surface antigen
VKKGLCRRLYSVGLILASVFVSVAWADFGVRIPIIYDDSDCQERFRMEQCDTNPCYGNGQALRFKQAVGGCSILTPEEELALAAQLPLIEKKRYYGRIRVSKGTLSLTRFRNQSTDFNSNAVLTNVISSMSQNGLELAVGYIWEPTFWGDLEYLVNKNFNHPATAIFVGSAQTFPFTIKNNTILANAYYNFIGFSRFEPYLTVGAGLAINSLHSTSLLGEHISVQNYGLALAGGVGMRIGFFKRWYLDFAYRYISLGSFNIKFSNSPVTFTRLNTNYNLSTVSIGVIFLF